MWLTESHGHLDNFKIENIYILYLMDMLVRFTARGRTPGLVTGMAIQIQM